jgi:MoxR-like ATPase
VSRLRDSQLGDARVGDIRNYIRKGKLWEAFTIDERPVLLIDEIDKADIEFPNDLLQELDRMEFYVYETHETIQAKHRPVVIITSNNEKELPDAFLRRCFFHYIKFPDPETMRASSTCTSPTSRAGWSRGAEGLLRRARGAGHQEEAVHIRAARLDQAAAERGHLARDAARERPAQADPAAARALLKNEQDVHLFERLAFIAKRQGAQ